VTGDDVATAMESVARAMRIRATVDPAEALHALALILGVALAAPAIENAPARRMAPATGSRTEAARAAGKASALVRKAIFGSAQPRPAPERTPERTPNGLPNEVTERTPNEVSMGEGGYGGSASGSGEFEAGNTAEDTESYETNHVGSGTRDSRTSPERDPNEVTERSLVSPERSLPNGLSGGAVERVFDAWRSEVNSPRSRLDRKRSARIRSRLAEGFSPEDLMQAIRNRRNDPFLMGRNDTGRVYDGIETLLRDAAQVERLMALTAPLKSAVVNGSKNAAASLLDRARRITEEEQRAAEAAGERA
jgi:hypothetical protein